MSDEIAGQGSAEREEKDMIRCWPWLLLNQWQDTGILSRQTKSQRALHDRNRMRAAAFRQTDPWCSSLSWKVNERNVSTSPARETT